MKEKVAILGGGSWGTTLAQVLLDNGHEVLIYDVNQRNIDLINRHIHPFFDLKLDPKIKALNDLNQVLEFSALVLLAVPTVAMRNVLKLVNQKLHKKTYFINVSKGIEPETFFRISEIVDQEIDKTKLAGFATLTGPSHAEEVIKRNLTLLTAASNNEAFAKRVQRIFSNRTYLRVYTTTDLIGAEVGGAAKNAIAVVSGFATGLELGENARAALITRGALEIVQVVEKMGGHRETAYGLTGIGDLIVTASSENSRNFRAGRRIGQGVPLDQVFQEATMTIEGVRSIVALHEFAISRQIDLPIINTAYEVLFENLEPKKAILNLLSRDLKDEKN